MDKRVDDSQLSRAELIDVLMKAGIIGVSAFLVYVAVIYGLSFLLSLGRV